MPCTAKKFEVAREEFSHDGVRDINISMTTAELADLVCELGVDFHSLPDEACDETMGLESGAGVIYGATGGVTEAVVRFAAPTASSRPRLRSPASSSASARFSGSPTAARPAT